VALPGAVKAALDRNPEIRAALQTEEKARRALAAARAEYIPEVSAFGQYVFQNGVPFLANNNALAGLRLNWNLFDWGRRGGVVNERRAQVTQAEENVRRIRNRVTLDVAKAHRKLERSREMVEVARAAVELRRESERISRDQVETGAALEAALREGVAATAKAEADLLAATLGYRLAVAEFRRYLGLSPSDPLP
jgi:outer membrane protein TolC